MLKLLAIGNSFSEDSLEYVYKIAESLGEKEIAVGNLYIGGCPIEMHAENARGDKPAYVYQKNTKGTWEKRPETKISYALADEEWDIVSFQQASHFSGKPNTFADLPYLMSYVRARTKKDVKLAWHMTWAYSQNTTHSAFPSYNSDQLTMYNAILDTVKKEVLPKNFDYLIPVGTAVQNARGVLGDDALSRDAFHLSLDLGRYIGGLTYVQVLTGRDVSKVAYAPQGVSEAQKKIAVSAVKKAISCPFGISEI